MEALDKGSPRLEAQSQLLLASQLESVMSPTLAKPTGLDESEQQDMLQRELQAALLQRAHAPRYDGKIGEASPVDSKGKLNEQEPGAALARGNDLDALTVPSAKSSRKSSSKPRSSV